jgi:hypothetical protein
MLAAATATPIPTFVPVEREIFPGGEVVLTDVDAVKGNIGVEDVEIEVVVEVEVPDMGIVALAGVETKSVCCQRIETPKALT